MILEDDMLNALLIEETLQFAGHRIVGPARTIDQALALLDRCEIDAAIIDLQIDDVISFDVGRRLEERGIPWALTTAHAPGVVAPQFAHVPLLTKPFTIAELLDMTERLLRAR